MARLKCVEFQVLERLNWKTNFFHRTAQNFQLRLSRRADNSRQQSPGAGMLRSRSSTSDPHLAQRRPPVGSSWRRAAGRTFCQNKQSSSKFSKEELRIVVHGLQPCISVGLRYMTWQRCMQTANRKCMEWPKKCCLTSSAFKL